MVFKNYIDYLKKKPLNLCQINAFTTVFVQYNRNNLLNLKKDIRYMYE